MKVARSDEAQLGAYLDSIDAILAHLQTSHAAWEPTKQILTFPNPADLEKFQAMVAQMQATARQLVADAHAHQAAAKAATQ
jgi:chaperone required for assembly of F1-ATPase